MFIDNFNSDRKTNHIILSYDFIVLGGGITGVCAAIAAARAGIKVALIQDRPVLGGNGSSEVRVWMLGATSHMGNNNRWAREGGIMGEILVENTYRNKEGNPVLFDMLLIDKVKAEENITLFLNTTAYDVRKKSDHTILSIETYNSSSETKYTFYGSLFCDSTGDGYLGYLAGASYRMGAEEEIEFNEKFAPDKKEYGECLGHSILLYLKETKEPVKYIAPDFAMKKETVASEILRVHTPEYFDPVHQTGCKYWWVEYGGRLDTIHDNDKIRFKLWEVVYGIWDYVKNSGKYPEADNQTLEWVGLMPGKRESRRFVGPYMLSQRDVIEQQIHYDAVAYGGWSIDLHPADGVFSKKKACNQWHSKGVFQIPYRCYVTQDIDNLFIGGRLISASHVSFGATRVMLTAGLGGEVIGTACHICLQNNWKPIELVAADRIVRLQEKLVLNNNYIPCLKQSWMEHRLENTSIMVSSELELSEIPFEGGEWRSLSCSVAQMLPVTKKKIPDITVVVRAHKKTELNVELRISSKSFNHTPDVTLARQKFVLDPGESELLISLDEEIPYDCYVFFCFIKNEEIEILFSEYRITGLLSVFNKAMPAVSNWGKQIPPKGIGVEEFEFWCPERRPEGKNIAMKICPGIRLFGKENLYTMHHRPVEKPNAWVAALDDSQPTIRLEWEKPQTIHALTLFTDTDYDHPMETIQWGHVDDRMPFCVDSVRVYNSQKTQIAEVNDNYRTRIDIRFEPALTETIVYLKLKNSSPKVPVSLFGIQLNGR